MAGGSGPVSTPLPGAAAETYSALHFIELDGEQRLIRLSLIDRVEDVPVAAFRASASVPLVTIGGRLIAALACDAGGDAVGYISCYRCAPNTRLWEVGNLLVVPAC